MEGGSLWTYAISYSIGGEYTRTYSWTGFFLEYLCILFEVRVRVLERVWKIFFFLFVKKFGTHEFLSKKLLFCFGRNFRVQPNTIELTTHWKVFKVKTGNIWQIFKICEFVSILKKFNVIKIGSMTFALSMNF